MGQMGKLAATEGEGAGVCRGSKLPLQQSGRCIKLQDAAQGGEVVGEQQSQQEVGEGSRKLRLL